MSYSVFRINIIMLLQPSIHTAFNDSRRLFSEELQHGGHGQIPISGTNTFTPSTSAHVFYRIDFTSASVVNSAGFRTLDSANRRIYVCPSNYSGFAFPSLYTWNAPLTSIKLTSGTGIAYEYKLFNSDESYSLA